LQAPAKVEKVAITTCWAENFLIHVPFPVPVMSFEVKYAVIFEEKLIFCGSVPFQSQGPVIFGTELGPKTKILSFLTMRTLGTDKDKINFAGNAL